MLSPQKAHTLDVNFSQEVVVIGYATFHRGYLASEVQLARLTAQTKFTGTEETLAAIWVMIGQNSSEVSSQGDKAPKIECFKLSFDKQSGNLNVWRRGTHVVGEDECAGLPIYEAAPYRLIEGFDRIKIGEPLAICVDGKEIITGPVINISVSSAQEFDPILSEERASSVVQPQLDPVSCSYQGSELGETVVSRELDLSLGYLGICLEQRNYAEAAELARFLSRLCILGKGYAKHTELLEAQTLILKANCEIEASKGNSSSAQIFVARLVNELSEKLAAAPEEEETSLVDLIFNEVDRRAIQRQEFNPLYDDTNALARVSPKDSLRFYEILKEQAEYLWFGGGSST